ncbi:MAG: DNA recombination protein RmuC [Kiritimatiellae bacterium]|nr:DNA recombination protein RmuC [Kiritimatiellia bacterium]MDW8459421.1 DNA recombination protein RmuC [Verrucomicrobiota bacterium]
MNMLPDLLILLLAASATFLAGWSLGRAAARRAASHETNEWIRRARDAETQSATLEGEARQLQGQLDTLRREFEELRNRLDAELQARVRAETQAREAAARLEAERSLLDDARTKLSDTFKALAGDTLAANTGEFLKLARASLEKIVADARGDISQRQAAIDALVRPISETLARMESNLREFEKNRAESFSGLREQINQLVSAHQLLQRETANLVHALKTPQTRGRWGELTLRRVVELAGMTQHVDFEEQVHVQAEGERARADLVVRLPNDRAVIVDAKVSMSAFLASVESDSEEARERALVQHAQQMRAHVDQLASREYWGKYEHSAEFVVMFVPGEAFLSAAVMKAPDLIEYALMRKVILATPASFLALLKAIAYGWRQASAEQNAKEICELGRQLHERIAIFIDHLNNAGQKLRSTVEAYNQAVSSFESRLIPSARRLSDLGAASSRTLENPNTLTVVPRSLEPPA